MGFLLPETPKAGSTKKVSDIAPPSAPTRSESSVALAGLRVFNRDNTGSLSQRAATGTTSGGTLGSQASTRNRRKRSLIGGGAA